MAVSKLAVLSQTYPADRASKIELLVLVSEVMVISRLKNTQWYFMEFMECLNKDVKKKEKRTVSVHQG